MSKFISPDTRFTELIKFKNLRFSKIDLYKAFFIRSIERIKDPYFFINKLQKFKPLNKRIYRLKDLYSNKVIFSPTYPQRQSALSAIYYKKNFFQGISETINNLKCKYIFDIGSNIGYYSRSYSIHGENLEIIAIEPSLRNISFLTRNIDDLSNVFVFQLGLSNKFGRFKLSIPKYGDYRKGERKKMTGLLSAIGNKDNKGTRFVSGDDLIQFLQIEPSLIGWVKIDVEGFEKNVIEGFSKTLLKTNAIFEIEINADTMKIGKFSLLEIINMMAAYNYFPHIKKGIINKIQIKKRLGAFDIYFAKPFAAKNFSNKLEISELNPEFGEMFDKQMLF